MDNQRDYPAFKRLLSRLCDTMGKPCTEELLESWWKALRHVQFAEVERRMEAFMARATDGTRFPRPAQMRPEESTPQIENGGNPIRDYWRSAIVHEVRSHLGYSHHGFEPVLITNRETLGRAMRDLLDDVAAQDARDGRTVGQHQFVVRRSEEIARTYRPGLAADGRAAA